MPGTPGLKVSVLFRFASIGVALFALGAVPLQAQTEAWSEPGDRVRISSDEVSGEFMVREVRSDGLVLQSDSASAGLDLPTASLIGLEVSQGRESRLRGVLTGGFAGAVLGGVFGLQCVQPHATCPVGSSSVAVTLMGAGLGALIGLVASGGGEMWQEVRLPERLAVTPGREDGDSASTASDDIGSDAVVEMIVRNQGSNAVTVFAWWEGGGRVRLGELGGGETRTFTARYRDRAVMLSVDVLSVRGVGRGSRPEEFIPVRPDDRLEWTIRRTDPVDLYLRLPPR